MGGRRFAWALGVSSLVMGVALDASAASEPMVFGPKEYGRTAGAPNTFSETFSVCATASPFRLRVENDPGTTAPVSSGSVTVNGAEVVREADFNPQMRLLERPVSLQRENRLVVRLAGKPGGAIRLSVAGEPGCLHVAFTSPLPGATVSPGLVPVRGFARGPAGIGVAVNGFPAFVEGESFAGLLVADASVSELIAVATAPDGTSAEARQPVDVMTPTGSSGSGSPVRLTASPPGGLAPLAVGFSLSSLVGVRAVSLDLHGTGATAFEGPGLEGRQFVFDQPGIYLPSVRITDVDGNVHAATALVHAYDRSALDGKLQAIWKGLKDALRSGDVARAATFIHTSRRAPYEAQFRLLTASVLSNIDAYLPAIDLVEVGFAGAQYELLRQRNGQTLSFAVWFQLDVDGIWRLVRF